MVRGLIIRQAFMALDLGLALLVAFVLFLVTGKLVEGAGGKLMTGPEQVAAAETDVPVWQLQERAEYNPIVDQGLFGDAGKFKQDTPPPAPVEEKPMEAAPSTLKLIGTGSADPEDPFGSAIIENAAARTQEERLQTYFIGQEIMPQLSLLQVYPRRVILFDAANNQKKELAMNSGPESAASPVALAANGEGGAPPAAQFTPGMAVLNKNEAEAELAQYDYNQLMSTLNPQMSTDEQGNINGITSDNINAIPLARRIGLQNGDVIKSVNGVNIDSEERLIEIFTRFQNSDQFRLGITRGGRQQDVSFRLN